MQWFSGLVGGNGEVFERSAFLRRNAGRFFGGGLMVGG